jgi:hypothetical protein
MRRFKWESWESDDEIEAGSQRGGHTGAELEPTIEEWLGE